MRKDLHDLELSDILGDAKVINLSEQKLERRKAHMNFLKRCKFVLKDSKGFEKLTLKLIECIENLEKMCSWQIALVRRKCVGLIMSDLANCEHRQFIEGYCKFWRKKRVLGTLPPFPRLPLKWQGRSKELVNVILVMISSQRLRHSKSSSGTLMV